MLSKTNLSSNVAAQQGPNRVRLEASTNCQLKCPSCPTTKGIIKNSIGGGFLKFDDFKKFINLNPSLKEIELSNWGEIFLNPELLKILEYAHSKKVRLEANNGVNLNHVRDEVLEGLVKFQFRFLNCSIDGTSQESYEKYRITGNYSRVIENIKKLNAFKKKYQSLYPILKWQFIIFGHNEHEIPEAKRLASELGMQIYFKLNWDKKFSPVKDSVFVKQETGLSSVSVTDFAEKNPRIYKSEVCLQLWDRTQINFDGAMLGCCVNHWGNFGNVFEDGLSRVFYGQKMSYARAMLMGRVPPRPDIPCSSCTKFKALAANSSFFRQDEVPKLAEGIYPIPGSIWWNIKKVVARSLTYPVHYFLSPSKAR